MSGSRRHRSSRRGQHWQSRWLGCQKTGTPQGFNKIVFHLTVFLGGNRGSGNQDNRQRWHHARTVAPEDLAKESTRTVSNHSPTNPATSHDAQAGLPNRGGRLPIHDQAALDVAFSLLFQSEKIPTGPQPLGAVEGFPGASER